MPDKKTISTLLGLAIGDALGQPFEFSNPKQIKDTGWDGQLIAGPELIPFTMWNLKPGQYTDDTKMALCIVNSLLAENKFVAQKISENYIKWVESRDLRGIGTTCERSIHNMMRGVPLSDSGKKGFSRVKPTFKKVSNPEGIVNQDSDFCGNGTVMRAGPIGLFYKDDLVALEQAAKSDASMTHNHPDARDSSYALCYYISKILSGLDLSDALVKVLELPYEYPHVLHSIMQGIDCVSEVISFEEAARLMDNGGCAHSTLGTAIYCILSTDNFRDAVVTAVKMGGDTDTRAAIVGAIAGTYYGLEGIPTEWVKGIEDSELLLRLDRELFLGPKEE
ncbi:MAG TPA: ADP-ribosylglycohydrolase family protein [Anaerovoracaceae bacterium]|nr:ADP-ribosylglycohydrolase family protein [Anaerovoracaceae bacterium]